MTAARDRPSLRPPPSDAADLLSFPAEEIPPNRQLFRVARRGRSPWWFGSSLMGRFDLRQPRGTCYLADDDLAALLEAMGSGRGRGVVSTRFLEGRCLHRLRLPVSHRVADCCSRRATRFGITGEIGAMVPYELPQAWAAKMDEAGFEGIVYRLRHDPAASRGVALFGLSGAADGWPEGQTEPISTALGRRLHEECGISVLEIPGSDELRLNPT